jgi:hypothetical protein
VLPLNPVECDFFFFVLKKVLGSSTANRGPHIIAR